MSRKKKKQVTQAELDEWFQEMEKTKTEDKEIQRLGQDELTIKDVGYTVVENYRDGFDFEAFVDRYQPYFERFDYIVGDWGYDQLRLRGFYQMNRRRVPRDQSIQLLDDYLKEYCNFGAAYFVVAKNEALENFEKARKSASTFNPSPTRRPNKSRRKPKIKTRSNQSKRRRRSRQSSNNHFTIK